MHHCWQIEEIVTLICSFVPRKDLPSVALTCRRLKEPALSALWSRLDNLRPLLRLLPDDIWEEAERDPGSTVRHTMMSRKRPFILSDLATLKLRASYVCSLGFCFGDNIDPMFLHNLTQLLATLSPDRVHFPRLQVLTINCPRDPEPCFNLVNMLISSRLTHIDIKHRAYHYAAEDTNHLIATLSRLASNAPSIVSFRLLWLGSNSRLPEPMTSAICSWSKLRIAECPALTHDTLLHLSKLDHFEELHSHSNFILDHDDLPSGFVSLCKLILGRENMERISNFLRSSQTSMLGDVIGEIDAVKPPTTDQWMNFLGIIARRCSEAGRLNLNISTFLDDGQVPSALGSDALRPLLGARNLVTFKLGEAVFFCLDDQFVQELAVASPHLRMLNLITTEPEIHRPTLTLQAYYYLLKHCNNLQWLGLAVDFSRPKEILQQKSVEWQIQRRMGPFELHVGDSPAEDPRAIAAFLYTVFDDLRLIAPGDSARFDVFHEVDEGWKEVESILAGRETMEFNEAIDWELS